MTNDERSQPDSADAEAPTGVTEPLAHADTPADAAAADERPSRWQALREPARRHPVGATVGAAAAGLLIGFVGGQVVDAHPMLSLTVGSTPSPGGVAQAPVPPPPGGDRGPGSLPWGPPSPGGPGGPGGPWGPGGPGPAGPPPPPGHDHDHGPGPSGPGSAGPPPRPGDRGPDGGPAGPPAGAPAPPGVDDAPAPPPGPGRGEAAPTAPSAPLPAERGA